MSFYLNTTKNHKKAYNYDNFLSHDPLLKIQTQRPIIQDKTIWVGSISNNNKKDTQILILNLRRVLLNRHRLYVISNIQIV